MDHAVKFLFARTGKLFYFQSVSPSEGEAMMVMVWSLRFSGLLAPNQWRHHLIHLRDVSGQRASKTRYQYRVFIFPPSQPASQPDRDNTDLRTENISSLELFCYSKIQTFLIRPRLEVYLVEFDRRCGKSNTLLRLKKHFGIKNTHRSDV